MKQLSLDLELTTPSMPILDVARCQAKLINYQTAMAMVKKYHYAHRRANTTFAVGMYIDDVLAGCCTFGSPAGPNVARTICGASYAHLVLELNRLFMFDWAGKNSESWMIGQAFRLLPQPTILIAYADIGENHIGYIYQATNWLYVGLSTLQSGPFSKIEVNGKNRTSKSFYRELGSQSREVILKHYPNAIFHERTRKHRYVYFVGNRRQRKALHKALELNVLSYPKENYE